MLTPPPSSPKAGDFFFDDGPDRLFEIQGSDGTVYLYAEALWVDDESDNYPGIPAIVIQEPNELDPDFALTQIGSDATKLFVLSHEVVEANREAAFELRQAKEWREEEWRMRQKKRFGKSFSPVLWK